MGSTVDRIGFVLPRHHPRKLYEYFRVVSLGSGLDIVVVGGGECLPHSLWQQPSYTGISIFAFIAVEDNDIFILDSGKIKPAHDFAKSFGLANGVGPAYRADFNSHSLSGLEELFP